MTACQLGQGGRIQKTFSCAHKSRHSELIIHHPSDICVAFGNPVNSVNNVNNVNTLRRTRRTRAGRRVYGVSWYQVH